MKVKIINGPNLNLLGRRNPEIYGSHTYEDLKKMVQDYAAKQCIDVSIIQSNHEGVLIDEIQSLLGSDYDGLIINPGALTHYSYAIRDSLEVLTIPIVEVHLSDIEAREDFRKVSVIKDVVDFRIWGKGIKGYLQALDYLLKTKKQ